MHRTPVSMMSSLRTLLAGALLIPAIGFAAELPAAVQAPGKVEVLRFHAEGVQIYECKADAGAKPSWKFREPLALLLKDGVTVGRHFAGPTWELASGSSIAGKLESQAPGATARDIPLLKLTVAQPQTSGEFAGVSSIQRIDTRGGAFAGPCDAAGALHLEPYAADYVFLK